MKKLVDYLKPLYNSNAKKIADEVYEFMATLERPKSHTEDHFWYKYLNMYTVYPDGVVYYRNRKPLQNLIPHLVHIRTLGCNAVHILPFLDSPMVDRGFDISNFSTVRPELGT